MKKFYSFIAAAILTVSLFTSCEKEDDRDAFVGTWHVTESWSNPYDSGTDDYYITISKSSTKDNGILITSLGGNAYNFVVEATVSGSSMNIPTQLINSGGYIYNISGSGTISGNSMSFTYYVQDGWTGSCTATKS